jgi:hypothetical protein
VAPVDLGDGLVVLVSAAAAEPRAILRASSRCRRFARDGIPDAVRADPAASGGVSLLASGSPTRARQPRVVDLLAFLSLAGVRAACPSMHRGLPVACSNTPPAGDGEAALYFERTRRDDMALEHVLRSEMR